MRQESPYADQQAIAFQRGDEKGLAFFFDELYPALCIYANYYTANEAAAQEIASEAFLKTWKTRSQFFRAGSIRAYLYTIVRRDAIKWHQKEKRIMDMRKNDDEKNVNEDNDNPFTNLVRAETARHLHRAISTLPPQCRKVFQLLYLEGKTVGEIAAILQLSPSTIKTQKQRGLEALRKQLTFPFLLFLTALVQKIMITL